LLRNLLNHRKDDGGNLLNHRKDDGGNLLNHRRDDGAQPPPPPKG